MAVLNLLTMLPYTIYSNANLPGEDASVEVLITWLYTGVVLMIVGMIVLSDSGHSSGDDLLYSGR